MPEEHICLMPASLRSWRYCVGARFKFWRRSRVPKKGSRDEAVEFLAASPLVTAPPSNLTRLYYNGSAAKSHLTTTQYGQLRRLDACIMFVSHKIHAGIQANKILITAQPIRNLRTPASAEMKKKGILVAGVPYPLSPIPFSFSFPPYPFSTPATQAKKT